MTHLRDTRLLTLVWVLCLLVLGAYVLHDSIGRTTQGFIAYYAASRLLVTGDFGPWVYEDAWFMRYVQDITGTRVLEIFGPNTPTMALLALPLGWSALAAYPRLYAAWLLWGLTVREMFRDRRPERAGAV